MDSHHPYYYCGNIRYSEEYFGRAVPVAYRGISLSRSMLLVIPWMTNGPILSLWSVIHRSRWYNVVVVTNHERTRWPSERSDSLDFWTTTTLLLGERMLILHPNDPQSIAIEPNTIIVDHSCVRPSLSESDVVVGLYPTRSVVMPYGWCGWKHPNYYFYYRHLDSHYDIGRRVMPS